MFSENAFEILREVLRLVLKSLIERCSWWIISEILLEIPVAHLQRLFPLHVVGDMFYKFRRRSTVLLWLLILEDFVGQCFHVQCSMSKFKRKASMFLFQKSKVCLCREGKFNLIMRALNQFGRGDSLHNLFYAAPRECE